MRTSNASTLPVVSVVGRSNTGKTTLLEGLLPALKAAGLRVAVVKDTFRFAEAGADLVVGVSPVQVATFTREKGSDDLDSVIAHHCVGYDLVLTEGYKRGVYPKIEVHRAELNADLLCDFGEMLALVTDTDWPTDVPQFALDDSVGLAAFIAAWLGSD